MEPAINPHISKEPQKVKRRVIAAAAADHSYYDGDVVEYVAEDVSRKIYNINQIDLSNIECKPFDIRKMFEYYLKQYMTIENPEYDIFKQTYSEELSSNIDKYAFFRKIYQTTPKIRTPFEKINRIWQHVYHPFTAEQVINAESNMGQTYNTPFAAREITKDIITYYFKAQNTQLLTILDANSNIGMDSISFCDYFKQVICIEYEPEVACALAHNIKNLTRKNAIVYQGSCLTLLATPKITTSIDIIYFDPPWNGSLWNSTGMLKLDGITINIIIIDCFKKIPNLKAIFLKIPKHKEEYTYLNKEINSEFDESLKDLGFPIKLTPNEIKYRSKYNRLFTYYLYSFIKQ